MSQRECRHVLEDFEEQITAKGCAEARAAVVALQG
jgi:hypothetical protein